MTSFVEWLKGKNSESMAGFSHVRRMLLGDIKSTDRFAILTAANPHAKRMSHSFNHKLMKNLEYNLRQKNYGPISVSGQYGHNEPSFIVNEPENPELFRFGDEWLLVTILVLQYIF